MTKDLEVLEVPAEIYDAIKLGHMLAYIAPKEYRRYKDSGTVIVKTTIKASSDAQKDQKLADFKNVGYGKCYSLSDIGAGKDANYVSKHGFQIVSLTSVLPHTDQTVHQDAVVQRSIDTSSFHRIKAKTQTYEIVLGDTPLKPNFSLNLRELDPKGKPTGSQLLCRMGSIMTLKPSDLKILFPKPGSMITILSLT